MEKTITAGEYIKSVANRKGVTLYALAIKTGRSAGSIYTILKKSSMQMRLFFQLLDALEDEITVEVDGKKVKLINN